MTLVFLGQAKLGQATPGSTLVILGYSRLAGMSFSDTGVSRVG